MNFNKKDLVKSPLNYTGGKFKLLPQILPLFPDNIDTFVDLFCGGCNVGVNVKANKIICSDTVEQLVNLFNSLKSNDKEQIFEDIFNIINEFGLSDSTKKSYEEYGCNTSDGLGKYNKEAYLKLRNKYNNLNQQGYQKDMMLYTLLCYSFSNQMRFNKKGGFNMPYGKRDFNKNMRKNLNTFLDKLKDIHIEFINNDFRNLKINDLSKQDLVYCDPPYLITTASYNEQDGWNNEKERELLNLLDSLHSKNIRFALSNVLETKGKSNDILKEWSKKYHIHYLNNTYKNCNYQRKDKSNNTIEVLITNY